ncbi:MAG: hypothetical protein M2R45_04997 [Verrucomicrobia subdivision 3 bacterium]|nr:hypothetical protein [Limisphaerales bacterium]MCS1415594.1 hypothetical protein [Limisphaerales bacterium]
MKQGVAIVGEKATMIARRFLPLRCCGAVIADSERERLFGSLTDIHFRMGATIPFENRLRKSLKSEKSRV